MKLLLICLIWIHQQNSVICPIVKKLVHDIRNFGELLSAVMQGVTQRLRDALTEEPEIPANKEEQFRPVIKTFNIIPAMSATVNESEPQTYVQLKTHPTALLPTHKLILLHDRVPEIHRIVTADGFYLTVHRLLLPQSKQLISDRTVLLHHGLFGSSADWLMLGDNNPLPYLLSDDGFDVWMTNARGNYYSQNHVKLQIDSAQFWNFTWQEMGQYDLPAVIDYIRKIKGNEDKIDFIGHSMGATALLVLLSTSTKYNDYIRMGVLLAPLSFMMDMESPLQSVVNTNFTLNVSNGEYFPRRKVKSSLVKKYCKEHRLYCNNPLFFLSGGLHYTSPLNKDRDFLATLLSHVPAGASTKTVVHYAQIANTRKFHQYGDYRKEFPLGEVTVPLALFSSNDDNLCSVASVNKLSISIAHPIEHVVLNDQNVTHTEFVWGHRADELVFRKVLSLLNSFNPNDVPIKLSLV